MTRRLVATALFRTWDYWERLLDWAGNQLDDVLDEALSCHSCGIEVRFLERYCPCCDTSYPARVPTRASIFLVGLPLLLIILCFLC